MRETGRERERESVCGGVIVYKKLGMNPDAEWLSVFWYVRIICDRERERVFARES